MRSARTNHNLRGAGRFARLGIVAVLGLVALVQAAPAQTAQPDAVYELWEQHWTLNADGSTVYHLKQHVRLNSDRAYDHFADPRITYNVETQKLDIINARTLRADGTYKGLADYSHVFVSPDQSAGWPAYSSIRQHLLVMSGVELGCVLELEYKITTKPGVRSLLAADVRLDAEYPVKRRVISATVPAGTPLKAVLHNGPNGKGDVALGKGPWVFENLPATPHEPQSPPWLLKAPRLAFSTAGEGEAWVRSRIQDVDAAADTSELIKKLAEEWTKGIKDPSEKLRAIQKKFAGRFNFVDFPVSWQPAQPTPASESLARGYGLPIDAAVALLSLGRAADLNVQPVLLVDELRWIESVAQPAMVDGYLVELRSTELFESYDPHHGLVDRMSAPGHIILADGVDHLRKTELPAWSARRDSRCRVLGVVKVGDDGKYTGDLTVRLSGLFSPAEKMRSADAQKGTLRSFVRRILPGADVASFAVESISEGWLVASVSVKSSKPLEKWGDAYCLQLAEKNPWSSKVSFPTGSATRQGDVWLAGAFDAEIELTIEWPEGWTLAGTPSQFAGSARRLGTVRQEVATDKNTLTIKQKAIVASQLLPASALLELRPVLNELRSEHARTLLLKP